MSAAPILLLPMYVSMDYARCIFVERNGASQGERM
jgi:hypothetical protein